MAKYLDQNGLLYFWQQVKPKIDAKVDKVEGKGLSANDFTDDLLAKLNGIAAGAQVNVIESIKVNGTAQTITEKGVDIAVPTKTSDITNDSGFITSADIPEGAAASTTVPLMDGEATVGTEMAFARGDHRHPTDTSRAAASDLTAAVNRIATIEGDYLKAADKYDDTALAGRVKAIEDDYLTEADKYDDTALAGRVTTLEGKAHEHANKALLDTYTQTEANLADAVAKKHEHANKAELDLIATGDKAKWDQAVIDIGTVKADYLTTTDKTELTGAIAAAKQEAIEAVLDGVTDDFDTLKEVAAWIQADTTASAELVSRVSAVEGEIDAIQADYLKAADKTALEESIADVAELVDTNGQTVSAYVAAQISENVQVVSNSEIDTILAS